MYFPITLNPQEIYYLIMNMKPAYDAGIDVSTTFYEIDIFGLIYFSAITSLT